MELPTYEQCLKQDLNNFFKLMNAASILDLGRKNNNQIYFFWQRIKTMKVDFYDITVDISDNCIMTITVSNEFNTESVILNFKDLSEKHSLSKCKEVYFKRVMSSTLDNATKGLMIFLYYSKFDTVSNLDRITFIKDTYSCDIHNIHSSLELFENVLVFKIFEQNKLKAHLELGTESICRIL